MPRVDTGDIQQRLYNDDKRGLPTSFWRDVDDARRRHEPPSLTLTKSRISGNEEYFQILTLPAKEIYRDFEVLLEDPRRARLADCWSGICIKVCCSSYSIQYQLELISIDIRRSYTWKISSTIDAVVISRSNLSIPQTSIVRYRFVARPLWWISDLIYENMQQSSDRTPIDAGFT